MQGKDLSDMSEDEREQLEEHRLAFRGIFRSSFDQDCLDSTEKPYPQPKRPATLTQACTDLLTVWSAEDSEDLSTCACRP